MLLEKNIKEHKIVVDHSIEKIVKEQEEYVMANNKKMGFINIQLFAEPDGAATPTDDTQQIDYEAEYKKVVAERDAFKSEAEKQKQMKDKYATENAEYKKKEVAKMSDEEKKASELKELIESKNKMEAELKTMRLEKDLLSNGFTAEESELLIKDNFAVKTIADILKKRIEENTKSVTAGLIKKTTPSDPVGSDIDKGKEKSAFAKYQESKKKTENIVKF